MWQKTDHPIARWRQYLFSKKWWTQEQDEKLQKQLKGEVLTALVTAEKKKKPSIASMFDDIYDIPTEDLTKQHQELLDHLEEYGQHYKLDTFAK